MEERALVTNVDGGNMKVHIIRMTQWGESCADCSGSCKSNSLEIDLANNIGAKVGDIVLLETETKKFMRQAYMVYGIPLVALIVGIVLGINGIVSIVKDYETNAMIIGFIMMFLSGEVLKILDNRFKIEDQMRVKRLIEKENK